MASDFSRREAEGMTVPLYAEEASLAKRTIETGYVKVSVATDLKENLVRELITNEKAEIKRVPIGKVLQQAPEAKVEGDTTIVPVVEEVLKVERQLILKEEIHIRRVRTSHIHQERVTLREQKVTIAHEPVNRIDGRDDISG